MEKRDKNRKFFHYNFFPKNHKGQARGNGKMLWFLLNLVFGLYFLNSGLHFITLPFITDTINNWVIGIGGALIIISGVMSMKGNSYMPRYR